MAKKELSYKLAMEELESIVKQLEDEDVDVDKLAGMIQRASELIQFCKARLIKSQEEVEKALKMFNEENED
ncbi:MAG: exodeoxyribonuclease VII small subunit [Bacteroidales bacterium]|nr:exodeoxyribonuclease VII small subunit [Bacteroidales bacterium]